MGRAALVVSGGILASRLLGFLREVVLAAILGRTGEADLYNAAFAVPDFIFFLMAGGYLTITFVPMISRYVADDDTLGANRTFTAVVRFVGGLMLILTALTMVLARPLTERFFPTFPPEQIPQLVDLVRMILPAQFFFVMGSLLMAVQYAHRRFLIPTLAPVVYNVAIIAGGLAAAVFGRPGPAGFVWGALAGAVVGNFALQLWGAYRLGTRWEAGVPVRHAAVGEYLVLAFPLMIGQSAVALDEVFLRVFGGLGGVGDIAGLNYARRLNMLPVGVIAQAAGVASYPFLARLFAEGNVAEMRSVVVRTVRASLVVAGLATAGVAALSLPLTQVAYQRGEFTVEDSLVVAALLAIYSLTIPMWAAHQVYTRGFYAQRRMWLPVGIGTAVTAVAIPLYIWAASGFGALGYAWANVGIMALYSASIALWWHREAAAGGLLATVARVAVAAGVAGAAGWGLAHLLTESRPSGLQLAALALVASAGIAVAVYYAALRLMGGPELAAVLRRAA